MSNGFLNTFLTLPSCAEAHIMVERIKHENMDEPKKSKGIKEVSKIVPLIQDAAYVHERNNLAKIKSSLPHHNGIPNIKTLNIIIILNMR